MAHPDKLGREMGKLDRKIAETLVNPPRSDDFWQRRWPSIVGRYAELVERGVWAINGR
jgi:hypothetical protein